MLLIKQILDHRGVDFARNSISNLAPVSTLCRLLMPIIVIENAYCFVEPECSLESLYHFKAGSKVRYGGPFESGWETLISDLSAKGRALSMPTLLLVELYATTEHPGDGRTDLFVRYDNELYWRARLGHDNVLDVIRSLNGAGSQDGIVGILVEGAVAEQQLEDQSLTPDGLRDLVNSTVCVLICAYDQETYLVCDANTNLRK